jgi:hypothetical protein
MATNQGPDGCRIMNLPEWDLNKEKYQVPINPKPGAAFIRFLAGLLSGANWLSDEPPLVVGSKTGIGCMLHLLPNTQEAKAVEYNKTPDC